MTMREDHITRVMELLEMEVDGELTTDQVAKRIVNTIYDSWAELLKSPPLVLAVGKAFKLPWSTKIYHVAWQSEDGWFTWIIESTSLYGALMGPEELASISRWAKPSTGAAGAPGGNKEWSKGARVSTANRRQVFEVIETGDKCVLLRDLRTGSVQAESNANLEKYFNKEK